MKTYLGDGVYAYYDEEGGAISGLVITTENGIQVTNRIFLEQMVFENLISFVNEIRKRHGDKPIIIPLEK